MGNHLAGIAPSQIFPVEHYLSELPELTFDKSLGSTRFLKVARAISDSGLIVVKVFSIHDQTLNLRKDRDKLLEIKQALEGCVNCLPFQRVLLTDKAAFVFRQYVKYSLYDRISTRPFLTSVEKKWIAFQLMLAVQQAHKHGVCHGDIKLENVMITSWNWVFLTDFASFKPTYLPEDNPADYSYFFDTARKRTCFIAPERFKTRKNPGATDPTQEENKSDSSQNLSSAAEMHEDIEHGELLPSMDVFSTGCVIIDLFTDCTPFFFSDLLAYRAGEFYPEKALNKIEDENIRAMVESMIAKDPNDRLTTNEHLSRQKGKAFPNYFYTFMQSYMQIFSSEPTMMPDQKIEKIHQNIDTILAMESSQNLGDDKKKDENTTFDKEGLVLIVSLITSNMRALKFNDSKLWALECLAKISKQIFSEIILERIVPYVIAFLGDSFSSVRIAALKSLTVCLQSVTEVPLSEANIFPEYILPYILPLCLDRNAQVRAAMAEHIAQLAQESKRFLDLALETSELVDGRPFPSYDFEVSALHDSIGQMVTVLLSDPVSNVKRSLMQHSVTTLAVFFGKVKANDIILSHMITFLNDKEDPQLRASFYDNIVGVAAFVGWQSSQILLPLLVQGLCDSEEFVISRCITAMASLTDLKLLKKHSLYELLFETTPYLLHPNLWIRMATTGLVSSASTFLLPIDVKVKLKSIISPFMQREVFQLDQPALILSNIESPVPRSIYDTVLMATSVTKFFMILEERQTKRIISKSSSQLILTHSPQQLQQQLMYPEVIDSNLNQLFRILFSEGMSANIEDKLLLMKEHLIKISKNIDMLKKVSRKKDEGKIDLLPLVNAGKIQLRSESLKTDDLRKMQPRQPQANQMSPPLPFNEEWQHMFGPDPVSDSQSKGGNRGESKSPIRVRSDVEKTNSPQHSYSHTSANFARCKVSLDSLIRKKRGEYDLSMKKYNQLGAYQVRDRTIPLSSWRPRGVLKAHLHEHEGAIAKLVRLPNHPIFASAADDGCVRLWDCKKMEGSSLVNKAHRIFRNHGENPLTSLSVCGNSELLASSSQDGLICVNSVETGSIVHRHQLDLDLKGPAVELAFMETGASPILVYGTAFGDIVGWDLRTPDREPAFKLENGLRWGLQTAMSVSEDQTWAVSGTSSGIIKCWDLRFQLAIVNCCHPAESRIRQLIASPWSTSSVIVSVQGNNEVGIWNMETQYRENVFWASSSPPLSKSNPSSQSVTSVYSIPSNLMKGLIMGGSDMRIRYWDLVNKPQSFLISTAGCDNISSGNVFYKTKIVDGIEVTVECHQRELSTTGTSTPPRGSESPDQFKKGGGSPSSQDTKAIAVHPPGDQMANKPGLEVPSTGHHDWISSIAMCQGSQANWYIITGSRDGVIKVWS